MKKLLSGLTALILLLGTIGAFATDEETGEVVGSVFRDNYASYTQYDVLVYRTFTADEDLYGVSVADQTDPLTALDNVAGEAPDAPVNAEITWIPEILNSGALTDTEIDTFNALTANEINALILAAMGYDLDPAQYSPEFQSLLTTLQDSEIMDALLDKYIQYVELDGVIYRFCVLEVAVTDETGSVLYYRYEYIVDPATGLWTLRRITESIFTYFMAARLEQSIEELLEKDEIAMKAVAWSTDFTDLQSALPAEGVTVDEENKTVTVEGTQLLYQDIAANKLVYEYDADGTNITKRTYTIPYAKLTYSDLYLSLLVYYGEPVLTMKTWAEWQLSLTVQGELKDRYIIKLLWDQAEDVILLSYEVVYGA